MNEVEIVVIAVLLALAAIGFLYRMLRGPDLADRVVGFDGFLSVAVIGILVHATASGSVDALPVVVVLALLAFSGTALVGRYIESGDDDG